LLQALKGSIEPQERCVFRSRRGTRLIDGLFRKREELRGAEEGDGRRSHHVERVVGGGRTRRPDEDLGGDIRRLNGEGQPMTALSRVCRGSFERRFDARGSFHLGNRKGLEDRSKGSTL
jgi:hypothetical protein